MIYENRMKDGEDRFPFVCAAMEGSQPFMTHCHQELEIIAVRKGSVKVINEGHIYMLGPGDLWLVPPFGSHSIEGGSDDSQRLAILLDLRIMGVWTKQEDEIIDISHMLENVDLYSGHWPAKTTAKAQRMIEGMYEEYKAGQDGWQLAIKTLLNQFVLLAVREMPRCGRTHPNKQVARIKNILEYVALHYCDDISLEACAAQVGFNSSYLSRYFRQYMGVTFQEYVKRLRIDRARWLLRNDKLTVTEISYQSGFKDIKTFNKLFKGECGMNPTQFRKQINLKM